MNKNDSISFATALPTSIPSATSMAPPAINVSGSPLVRVPLPENAETAKKWLPTIDESIFKEDKLNLDEILHRVNESSGSINSHQVKQLKDQGYQQGLVRELVLNTVLFPIRFWVMDNR